MNGCVRVCELALVSLTLLYVLCMCRTQLKADKELTEEGLLLPHNHDNCQDSGLVKGGRILQEIRAEPCACE